MRLDHDGVQFDMLSEEDLTWVEADAVERVTGLTLVQIGSMGQVCGCGHRLSQHRPVDPEDENDLQCIECGCDTPSANTKSQVAQAMLWVSMKRTNPELTFRDVGEMPAASFVPVKDAEPDPTEAVDSTADAPST